MYNMKVYDNKKIIWEDELDRQLQSDSIMIALLHCGGLSYATDMVLYNDKKEIHRVGHNNIGRLIYAKKVILNILMDQTRYLTRCILMSYIFQRIEKIKYIFYYRNLSHKDRLCIDEDYCYRTPRADTIGYDCIIIIDDDIHCPIMEKIKYGNKFLSFEI